MFKICQIVFALFAAGGIVFYFWKKRQCQRCMVLMLIGLLAVSSLISDAVLQRIPLPTDQVVVTALGEKKPEALKNEVSIKGYLVGGKEYTLKNPVEGKWFWQGNTYKWREENDSRQPQGTTRSITLEIPYGKGRSIQFYASKWNGLVEVTDHGNSQRYDLFTAGDESVVNAAVADTDSTALYLAKLARLLIFVGIIIILMAYPCYEVSKFGNERMKRFLNMRWSNLTYIALAVCCFVVMVKNSDGASFWYDEIWTVGWTYLGSPTSPSIYLLLNDFWFTRMPYGQKYLLLLPELFVAASIYLAGSTGELYQGKQFGVIMAALAASSLPLMVQGGSEFRPYAMLLFSMFGLLYFFLKKQRTMEKSVLAIVGYVIFLILAMDVHPFGLVFSGLLMIFDFVLILLKKVKPIGLVKLIVPGLYGIHSLICTLGVSDMSSYGGSWASMPTIRGVVSYIKYLCNDSNVLLSLLIIGIVIAVVQLLDRSAWKSSEFWNSYSLLTTLLAPASLIALIFLYSFIFKGASMFVDRYFTVLIPEVTFFIATAIDTIFEAFLGRTMAKKRETAICMLSCVLISCMFAWTALPTVYAHGGEDYRGSAEYLMSQNDIYSPSTICLLYGNKYCNAGFDYYLTQKEKRDPIIHVSNEEIQNKKLCEYETIYCVYHHRNQPNSAFFSENGYVEEYSNERLKLKKYVKKS